ncbi:chaperone modulator CbpM [Bosea sp. PAMC 26642]|uniref:chaperone modulator CbpM n=1 Tax=Bosea sp. (strain PAMC 26642) TaxID=1792307 RepID=UPI001439C267|nr:chaperone modulator CbpM [Bosea sp. PAMC 26642]
MTFDVLIATMPEFQRSEVEDWIASDWVRPSKRSENWMFDDIDVARMRLIRDLRFDLRLDEHALPFVLHLLDQLYDARRGLHRVRKALENDVPEEIRAAMLMALLGSFPDDGQASETSN